MGMVYYWLYHTVQKRGSMQSTSCPTSISLVRQAYLVKAFCLPPKVNDLGSLSFLDGVLVMEQTEQAHGINHRCKTATNDSWKTDSFGSFPAHCSPRSCHPSMLRMAGTCWLTAMSQDVLRRTVRSTHHPNMGMMFADQWGKAPCFSPDMF